MITEILLLALIVFFLSAIFATIIRGAFNLQKVWKYVFNIISIVFLIFIFGFYLKIPIFNIITQIFSYTVLISIFSILTILIALITGIELGNWIENKLMK